MPRSSRRLSSATISRLKAFISFFDNFTRVTVVDLGKSTSNGLWKAVRGIWLSDGSAATTASLPSTYPMSTVQMSSSGVTASVATGSGGKVISATGTVGSILVGGTQSGLYTYGQLGFFEATVTGMTSTVGLAVGNWIQATNGTGSLYGGVPDYVEITSIESLTSIKYRVKGGSAPTAGTITNISTRGNDGGTGLSLWVTDSGNWWGVSYGRTIDTSCNCSTCNSGSCSAYTNYASSYCGGYTNYSSNYCGGYSFSPTSYCGGYSFSPSSYCGGYSFSPSTYCGAYAYFTSSYCGGWSNSQTSYCVVYTQNASYSCGGWTSQTSYSCNTWTSGATSCIFYAGGICVAYTSNIRCASWSSNTSSVCIGGYGVSYSTNCAAATYGTTQTCSGGFYTNYANVTCNASYTSYGNITCSGGTYTTWNNITCSGGTYINYGSTTCSGGTYTAWSPSCSGGNYTAYAPACSLTTYAYSSCNCQTCYPGYIRVFQSASNAITEVARWTLSSMSAAFKVITNKANKVITIKPYRDKGMTSQIGSDLTYTASAATIETKFGIVLSPSDYIQGNQADDFNIASN